MPKRVAWFKENNINASSASKIDIDMYVDGKNLNLESVLNIFLNYQYPNFEVVIHNNSAFSYTPVDYQFGVITTDYKTVITDDVGISTTKLPDGKYLHLVITSEFLFPQAYTKTLFRFNHFDMSGEQDMFKKTDMLIRLFTNKGVRDYPISIVRSQDVQT